MTKQFKILMPVMALALFSFQNLSAQFDNPTATTEKFNTLIYWIENMYVDSTNTEQLVEVAIEAMLKELDPHSVYISKEELQGANEPLNGNFEGIGIRFNIMNDTILVVNPISGGPSEKLGILAGDRIVKVDGENVAGIGINNGDVMKLLKGPKGTKVEVGISRGGSDQLIDFPIIRDKIPIYSVDASFMVDDQIGYLKVSRFAKTTMNEMREAMAELKSQGMTSLILDLQDNGGGLLNTAIEMSDEFLSDNKLIVYTEGRAFPKDETFAHNPGMFEEGRLVVLIDESSASASEIVSGAVQDWDRGLIVGRRSFGKGLVQRPVSLPDKSAVRLTVQKYYTPAGRCIQKPYEEGVEAYYKEKYERYESGEMYSMDGIELPDSLMFKTKVKGRTVYGGGGILPDIFVPADTSNSSQYFTDLLRKSVTSQFSMEYIDANRDQLNSMYPEKKQFINDFNVSAEMEKEFLAFAEKNEVEFDEEGWNTSKFAIKLRIKALMARTLYDSAAFYQVISELNASYRKAVSVLQDGTFEKANLAKTK